MESPLYELVSLMSHDLNYFHYTMDLSSCVFLMHLFSENNRLIA